jgi:hypothetical protein
MMGRALTDGTGVAWATSVMLIDDVYISEAQIYHEARFDKVLGSIGHFGGKPRLYVTHSYRY